MSFRDELLQALDDDYGITPKTIAKGIAQVIKGESVVEKHAKNKDREGYFGELQLVERKVSTTPSDVMFGAMMYDALRGGDLGIAPAHMKDSRGTKPVEIVHRRFDVDRQVIANSDEAVARATGALIRVGDFSLDELIPGLENK